MPSSEPSRALTTPSGPVFILDKAILQQAILASRAHPRRRVMQPIQRSEQALVQRLLNIMQPGSYVQPHKHPRPQAVELIQPIQGSIRAFIFDDKGSVTRSVCLKAGSIPCLLDIEPNVWHTFCALEPDTVVLEVKGGPYDASRDKIFADWAPSEQQPGAPSFLNALLAKE